jgi:ATP-dependent Clp protease ATP-binding subunit ClpA
VTSQHPPTPTPRYQKILKSAAEIATVLGHQHVGVEHVFLAVIRDSDAVPTQVLAKVTDIGALDEKLRVLMTSPSYNKTAPIPE